jgi:hypothetical protein
MRLRNDVAAGATHVGVVELAGESRKRGGRKVLQDGSGYQEEMLRDREREREEDAQRAVKLLR